MTPPSVVKVMVVIGTRPEAIKLAPVVHELARHAADLSPFVCATGQHRELLGRTLDILNLRADLNLEVMEHDQDLAGLTSRLFEGLDRVIRDRQPNWLSGPRRHDDGDGRGHGRVLSTRARRTRRSRLAHGRSMPALSRRAQPAHRRSLFRPLLRADRVSEGQPARRRCGA